MLSFAVTDLSNNFDFDFTTLNRKALYESYLFNFPVFIFPKVFFFWRRFEAWIYSYQDRDLR